MQSRTQKFQVFLTGYCRFQYSEEELSSLLSKTLPGFKSLIIPNKRYKGFAFLELQTQKHQEALLNQKEITIEENDFIVKPVKSGNELAIEQKKTIKRKIFISNIPLYWKDDTVYQCFSPFGELEEAYICEIENKGPNGKKIGYAIYKDEKSAREVTKKRSLEFLNQRIFVEPAHNSNKKGNNYYGNFKKKNYYSRHEHANQDHLKQKKDNKKIFRDSHPVSLQNHSFSRSEKIGNQYYDKEKKEYLRNLKNEKSYNNQIANENSFPKKNEKNFSKNKGEINLENSDDINGNYIENQEVDHIIKYYNHKGKKPSFRKRKVSLGKIAKFHSVRPNCQEYFIRKFDIFGLNVKKRDDSLSNLRINKPIRKVERFGIWLSNEKAPYFC